jgi:hypothetical protein
MLVRGVWAESLGSVTGGAIPRKCAAIGTSRLMTECPELLADQQTFGALLRALVLMLVSDQGPAAAPLNLGGQEDDAEDAELEGGGGGVGYVAAYAALSFASPTEEVDFYVNETSMAYAQRALNELKVSSGPALAAILPAIGQGLPPEQQRNVTLLLQTCGLG